MSLKKPRTYRMAIVASVCISVQAESAQEAIAKAESIRDLYGDGLDVEVGDRPLEMRCYMDGDDIPTVENIEDESPTSSS